MTTSETNALRLPGRIRVAAYRFSREALVALLAMPMLLLLVLTFCLYTYKLLRALEQNVYSTTLLSVGLALGVAVIFATVMRRETAYQPRFFLACSLGFAATLYASYIASIEVAWVSDFQGMWLRGLEMTSSGDYTVRTIYNERALPVIVPIIKLFGPHTGVVPIVNACFLLAIQGAGYDLVRRIAGHRAAQGFTVLWIAAMEPILAMPITSHDIWGLFFLVCFLWGYRVACDLLAAGKAATVTGKVTVLGIVACLSIALTLLDMQRELFPLVLLSFILSAAMLLLAPGGKQNLKMPSLLIGIVLLLYVGISSTLKSNGLMLTAEQSTRLTQIRTGVYGSSLSNGTYGQGQAIWKDYFASSNRNTRENLTKTIPLSDLVLQPEARVTNLVHRGFKQAALGSQYFFYQSGAKTDVPWLVPLSRAYNQSYAVLIALLGFCTLISYLRRASSIHGLLPLCFISSLTGILLLMGESQPRYIFPIWFVLPMMIATAFDHRPGEAIASKRGVDILRGVAILVLIYALLVMCSRWFYGEPQGRILSDWKASLHGVTRAPLEDWFESLQSASGSRIRKEARDNRPRLFGKLAVVMKIPAQATAGGSMNIRKRVCVGKDRRALGFFYYMPYQNQRAAGAFRLSFSVDGRRLWSARLPGTQRPKYARIADILPAGHCGTIEFELKTNRPINRASWINASQTDLYFPGLVR